MSFIHRRLLLVTILSPLLLFGCTLPALPIPTQFPTPGADAYAATIGAMQTRAVQTAGAQGFGPTSTPTPETTIVVPQTGAGQSPVVVQDTTCWRGPGQDYAAISTIQHGTAISLLGRGVIAGWLIARDPTYGDPCWLQLSSVQIPPGLDISALPVYNPPWTPTPPRPPTPTSTP